MLLIIGDGLEETMKLCPDKRIAAIYFAVRKILQETYLNMPIGIISAYSLKYTFIVFQIGLSKGIDEI